MTTTSGKPPVDETLEASPPRRKDVAGGREAYGTVVPYGGDDRTEEIEPIELDMPFSPEATRTATGLQPPIPPRETANPTLQHQAGAAGPSAPPGKRDYELPVAHLVMSDLFDSTPPPPGAMDPPDLAAFSSRPPPGSAAEQGQPGAKPAGLGWAAPALAAPAAAKPDTPRLDPDDAPTSVVPVPNIPVGSGAGASAAQRAAEAPSRSSELEAANVEAAEPARERRSVPTLESAGNAAAKRASTPDKSVIDSSGAARPALADIARFPSDVPTSKPPEVVLSAAAPAAAPTAQREARPVAQSGIIASPAPALTVPKAQLPSIMLAADVEAEGDAATRRALRAARATVRIELPSDLLRPGSPLHGLPISAPAPVAAQPEPARAEGGLLATISRHWLAISLVLLVLAAGLFWLRPQPGSLVVNARGPAHRTVKDLQIFVDGTPLCKFSPCAIEGLSEGAHKLHAAAAGLASKGEEIIEIVAGEESVVNLDLVETEPDRQSGGLRIGASDPPRILYVDETRVGPLPREVSGLTSGKHWIKLDAEDGSPPIEKAVNIVPGQIIDVEPTPARRDKAQLTIRLSRDSEGAQVTFDDAVLLDFPAELELEPNSEHSLLASKPGFSEFALDLTAKEAGSEQTIEIALERDGSAPAPARPKAKSRKAAAKASAPNIDATQGLLNISSIPPSQIILNGRPLGASPKNGVVVPGDSLQTIVFVHPKMGRRRAQKFVPAGKERTVAIRF